MTTAILGEVEHVKGYELQSAFNYSLFLPLQSSRIASANRQIRTPLEKQQNLADLRYHTLAPRHYHCLRRMVFNNILRRHKTCLLLSKLAAKLRLIYYQYSVTLPLYGLQPIEACILNAIVLLSAAVLFRSGVFLVCIAVRRLELVLA